MKRLQSIEPNNHQAKDLERVIEGKMKSGEFTIFFNVIFRIKEKRPASIQYGKIQFLTLLTVNSIWGVVPPP